MIDDKLKKTSQGQLPPGQTSLNSWQRSSQQSSSQSQRFKAPRSTTYVTTTSGKKYTLDDNMRNWIASRWKRDGADSYGYDDDDQMAKRNGQMSAAMRGTYKNSQVDRDLFSMGLPSEKYLERYMEDYDRWHTGDISTVFGNNVPDDDWTGMKRMYQQSFRYENTPEDQARKRQGLVPLSQLDKYTDTELDDDLLSKGLPPMAELGKYAGMYNNYKGVDNLYKNAALAYTRVRATQDVNGKFIQNDNNSYTVMDPTTGQTTTMTGKQWYAKSFYDELGRTNEDGSFVYGNIIPLLKKSRSESEDDDYVDPTKSFIEQMDKQFAAYGKEDDNEDDFLNHQAFSYDDFAKNYESYYTKYIKDLQANGQGQTIGDLFSVAAMEADADAARAYYDVQPGQEAEFITRFRKDHPEATAGDMFTSILSSGSSIKTARRVMQEARRNTDITGGKNYREDGWGWYDIGDGFTKAKGKVAEAPSAAATPENKNATFNFNDVYTAVSRDYDASAEAAKAEQRSLRKSNRQPSEAEPVDEEFLEKIRDAITVYDSAAKAYEDTAGPGAPSEASREPINKANELLKSLGFKSIHSARRYVDSVAKGEEEDEAKRKAVGDALKAYDSAKADAGLAGDAKSAQAVIDAEKKVTSLLGVNSAEDAREWLRTGELPGKLSANGSAVDVDDAIRIAQTYMEQNGGWNKTVATDAFKKLYDMGVSPEVVQQAAAEMNERFGDMEETFTEKGKPDEPSDMELLESMNAAVAAGEKADEEDVEAITAARNAIEGALVDDNGPIYSTVDGVIGVLDSVAARTNPAAMRLALADLGFVGNLGDGQVDYGEFTGTADDLTTGWSEADKTKLRYKLLDYANGWTIRKPTADEKATDNLVDKIGRDLGLDDWMLGDHSAPNKVIEHGKFEKALEWAQQQIDSGALTDWRAYNILASAGYQDEMEQYMPEEWHKAHFKAVVVPQEAGKATGLNQLTWEEMTPEQRDAMAEELWAKMTPEEKAARYGDPNWWKYDTSVQRTGAQALDQQMSAILPGLIAQAVSTPVTIADAVFAGISGRPEMWDFSKKLSGIQQDISSYGSVDGSVLNGDVPVGVKAAQWATDAVQELVKMEFLGNIGGMVGEAFKGTAVGGKVLKATASSSKVVKKVADMFLGAVQASPFVAESFAGHYTEAKQRGASNGEAAFYGAVCGLSEGLIEGFNFDKIWGKAIGSEKIAERLMQGGLDYLKMGLNGQAVLSSIALGFLGEATEEFVGYGIETGMKMKYKDAWGKGTQWSWADAGEQALVGGILGALGAGLHSGSITTRNIIMDYAIDTGNVEAFMKVAPDITMSIGIAEGMSEGDLEMYRKGGAKIMSSTAYSEMLTQMANLDAGIENAGIKLEKDKADLQRELENRLIEIDEKAAKGVGIDLDAKGGASLKEALDAFSKKCNELGVDIHDIDLAKYISGGMTEQERAATEALLSQRSQEAVQRNKDAVRKSYDKAIADAEAKCKTTVEQNMKLYDGLTKQMQEHWVGIYLANYNNIISGMTDEMVSNLAKAYRNGMQYDPEVAAEQAAKRAAQAKAEEAKAAEAEEAEATASSPEGTAAPTSIREAAYNRVYTDQEAGKVYASEAGEAEGATPLERAENARKNFQAKTTTRFRRVTLELAGFEASEGMSAKEIITEAKKTMTPEAAQKLDMYMKLSKALSLNMVVRDVVPGTSGYVQDGKLYVTLSGKQSLLRVVSHELTHYMQTYASDGYSNLRSHLVDEVGGQEAFDQRVAEKAQQYGYDLNTADGKAAADDEVCAELCESMLENKDALERFVNKDMEAAKTLKARLAKTLVAVKSAIRSLGTSDSQAKSELAKEQETVEAWYTTLSDAIDNANKAKAKPEAEATTETAPVEVTGIDELYMGDEEARREQLRSDLEKLSEKGTKVKGYTYQEVNELLDGVVFGDAENYNRADLARVRGMLAQLIPDVEAYANGDTNVDIDALNEKLNAAVGYMLDHYHENNSDELTALREAIPSKIALTDTAYDDLRNSKEMTLREASRELTKALGKRVSLVFKKSPDYNNAEHLDTLWNNMKDGIANGHPSFSEDVGALLDLVNNVREAGSSSFDDLYRSQREDIVASQVNDFLNAVEGMTSRKTAQQDDAVRHLLELEQGDSNADASRSFVQMSPEEIETLGGDIMYHLDLAVDSRTRAACDPLIARIASDARNGQLKQSYANGIIFARIKGYGNYEFEIIGQEDNDFEAINRIYDNPDRRGGNRRNRQGNGSRDGEGVATERNRPAGGFGQPVQDDSSVQRRGYSESYGGRLGQSSTEIELADDRFRDDDYMPLAERHAAGIATNEDRDRMQELVDEAAYAAGLPPAEYALTVYDKDGNVVPLEKRFSPDSTANHMLDDDWDALIEKYGAKPQGREPRARDVQVPNQVNNATRVSNLGRSILESNKVTSDMAQDAKQMMVSKNWLSYIPKANAETMAEARNFIAARQPLAAQQEFHDMVMQGRYGLKTNAIGLQLLSDAADRGDTQSFYDIATDLQIAATEAGQSAQIFNVLKELKGVGSAYYMQRVIDRLNTKYDDLIQKGKMDRITVSQDLMDQLTQAKTVDEIAAAEEAVAKEIARQTPLTWTDRLSNWRYFSMLANPTTHIRNMFGNILMKGLNAGKDVVATGLENVLNVDEDQRAHAIVTAKDNATWGSWVENSYKEQARNLSGGGKLGFETFIKQNMRSFDTKWLNALAQFNFKALEDEDIAFIRPAYKKALTEFMKARGYTLNENGVAGKVDAKGVFQEMSNAEMTEAVDWASQQAWKATFRDASSLATMFNKLSKENAVSRLLVEGVMPFKKTPINIAKRGLEYSPAGIIMGTTQLLTKVKQGKMSAATAIDNLASGITGTALMALGVMLAKAGVIRAGGEKDKKLETYLEDTGDQTYAMKFGDASINMSAIAPATIPLFMGVALNEMIDQSGEGFDLSTITDVLAGTLNPFMEMSFMSSLNSALKNYSSNGIGGALGSTLLTAAQNYGSQYLPTLGGKIAQFFDPTQRTTKSDATSPIGGNMDYYLRSLAKKVPGVEATLQPDVNVWGQTNTKDSFGEWLLDFANKFVLPTNVKITNRDEVDRELIRVVESTGVSDFLPSDGNKYFTVKGEKYTMNARQYAQYSQERGQAAYAAIKELMQSPSYINASDETKAEMLRKAREAAYKTVNNIWKDRLGAFNH